MEDVCPSPGATDSRSPTRSQATARRWRRARDGRARRRVDSGDPAAFRANYEAFSREPGLHAELAACGVPLLLYAGTADPWHEPMRAFAERAGTGFSSVSGADHKGCRDRSADVLPQVLAFLAASP